MATATKLQTGFDPSAIPQLLKDMPRWGLWKPVWRERKQGGGRWEKYPVLPTSEPDKWLTFEDAVKQAKNGLGLGFLLSGIENIVTFDLDKCINEGGVPEAWAADFIGRTQSYTEVSPSGRGLRIFAIGTYDTDWQTRDEISLETYVGLSNRYVTVTGHIWPGCTDDVTVLSQDVLDSIAKDYRVSATVVDLPQSEMPDLLDEVAIPESLDGEARKFLETGECEDRSAAVHWLAKSLFEAGCDEQQVLSVLVANPHALQTGLDHRRQDFDRALLYLWKHHVLKTKTKAKTMAELSDFDDVSVPTEKRIPAFQRDKHGNIDASCGNVVRALLSRPMLGVDVRLDDFKDEIVISHDGGVNWRAFRDADYTRLRIQLEQKQFKPVGRELIRDAILLVAEDNRFDTAIHWIKSLPKWDGVSRVDNFFADYFGAEDSAYTRAVSRYIWSAMAGRVLVPGIKADMVPILIGDQGVKKSSSIAEMVPHKEFFTEIDLDERKGADNSRKMRGVLVAELSELRGLKTKDAEHVKAFLTRTHEKWTPKYKEFDNTFARRLVFIGTTNEEQFLDDMTGNRRFLPMRTEAADIKAIVRDRDQLWAEAVVVFLKDGICFEKAEQLAKHVHADHMISEPWAEEIEIWMNSDDDLVGGKPTDREFLTRLEVMRGALRLDPVRQDRWTDMRIAKAMAELGWKKVQRRVGGKPTRVFVRP